MALKPKRVAVIGLDCALPHLIEQHITEGHLPTFKGLIEKGVIADNCLVPYPTITPPNWATIATGAWAGTHGVTDFHVPIAGETPNTHNVVAAFSSERVQAEYIWDALDKVGKKCVVMNYPGSWPSNMKNGIVVGGAGLSVNDHRDGHWGLESTHSVSLDMLITTGVYPLGIKGEFVEAQGWTNADEAGDEPLEMAAKLNFPQASREMAETTWYVLVHENENGEYERVTLSPTKNISDAFCTLSVGEWSHKVETTVHFEDGEDTRVYFRCKLIELSDDAEDFRLLVGCLNPTEGFAQPPEVCNRLESDEGTMGPTGGLLGLMNGWYDLETYVEINEQHDQWLGDAAVTLLKDQDWDLFYMHSHPPDWMYHVIINDMDPDVTKDAAVRKRAWQAHLRIYQSQDRMIGRILEACGKGTLVTLVSDHGATADGPYIDPYLPLVEAGLTKMLEGGPKKELEEGLGIFAAKLDARTKLPDPSESKAMPQRSCYIYVNLKGRDPEGIVEPEDYQKVQREIIDALYDYVHPNTGKRPFSLVLSKQDARILGLYGDNVGDVVYALHPEYGSQHGQILPTAKIGIGDLRGLLSLTGSGLKKNHRLQRTVWLTDIVPTICYLMDWPLPEQAEGAVIYQAFKNPNFKAKEIDKMKEALGRMETAIYRKNREPWDKHDCA